MARHSKVLARYILGMQGTIAHGNCIALGAFAVSPSLESNAGEVRKLAEITASGRGLWSLDLTFRRPVATRFEV